MYKSSGILLPKIDMKSWTEEKKIREQCIMELCRAVRIFVRLYSSWNVLNCFDLEYAGHYDLQLELYGEFIRIRESKTPWDNSVITMHTRDDLFMFCKTMKGQERQEYILRSVQSVIERYMSRKNKVKSYQVTKIGEDIPRLVFEVTRSQITFTIELGLEPYSSDEPYYDVDMLCEIITCPIVTRPKGNTYPNLTVSKLQLHGNEMSRLSVQNILNNMKSLYAVSLQDKFPIQSKSVNYLKFVQFIMKERKLAETFSIDKYFELSLRDIGVLGRDGVPSMCGICCDESDNLTFIMYECRHYICTACFAQLHSHKSYQSYKCHLCREDTTVISQLNGDC